MLQHKISFDIITPHTLRRQLQAQPAPCVLDVREDWEAQATPMKGAPVTHIPMQQVPQHLEELRGCQPIVVVCRSGARSASVCEYLFEQGITQVANLQGGVLAWGNGPEDTE